MKEKIFLIDVSHIIYSYYSIYGFKEDIDYKLSSDGKKVKILNTKPFEYLFSFLNHVSGNGTHRIVIIGDRSQKSRIEYFKRLSHIEDGYKEHRKKDLGRIMFKKVFEAILKASEHKMIYRDNFEADDILFEVINTLKNEDLEIYFLANDFDLVPLIDDNVHFFRKVKFKDTSSLYSHPRINGYSLITKESYEDYFKNVYTTKNLKVPYNTMLLVKMIRGDKSDNIPGIKGVTPKKYNAFIENLETKHSDFIDYFKYYNWGREFVNINTDKKYSKLNEVPIEELKNKEIKAFFTPPKEILTMKEILCDYFDEEEINLIIDRYNGMNLNTAFFLNDDEFERRPIILDKKMFNNSMFNYSKILQVINKPLVIEN